MEQWTTTAEEETLMIDRGLAKEAICRRSTLSPVMAGLVPAIPLSHPLPVRQFYLYILASRPGGAIYIGVTSNLVRRVYEHRNGFVEGHTKRYHIYRLVYFEVFSTARDAIQREKT